tara:strand:+ start:352062 stop:352823 length:762 start_codon:yes stop_codon:yes gene_type:complete
MLKKYQITASIVLFNEDVKELLRCVDSFLKVPLTKKLYLIDNSPTDRLKDRFKHPEIEYIFTGKNLGFGKGHNLIIDKIHNAAEYHLILNPDISFEPEVLLTLIDQLKKDAAVTMVAPKVVYPDGELQYTCRKYPTMLELVVRRMNIFKNYTQKREYRNTDLAQPFYPDFIHGVFYLFKTVDLVKINGFDERYFLYMEDVDICRKIDALGNKKYYFPKVQITHVHKKASASTTNLFFVHLHSSFKYFYKWGLK